MDHWAINRMQYDIDSWAARRDVGDDECAGSLLVECLLVRLANESGEIE